MSDREMLTSKQTVRHAARLDKSCLTLCGASSGRLTEPNETVDCPTCRVILNQVRNRYPKHAGYTDWRLTKEQMQQAARDMRADMYGEIEG